MSGKRKHGWHPRVYSQPPTDPALRTYALTDATAIKIGCTANHPHLRMADLQVGNPRALVLVAFTATVTEAEAQQRLQPWHLRGEWYRLVPEVLAQLADWDFLEERVYAWLLTEASAEAETVRIEADSDEALIQAVAQVLKGK
jgi:hypothetical protein